MAGADEFQRGLAIHCLRSSGERNGLVVVVFSWIHLVSELFFNVDGNTSQLVNYFLKRFEIKKKGNLLSFHLEADGFLHHMARNLVGTLLEMGRNKLDLQGLEKILAAKDRRKAGATAPAFGLILLSVSY